MRITTESGSVYEIDDRRICRKYNSDGKMIDSFKVFYMKPVDDAATTLKDIYDGPDEDPQVGKRLYIGGLDNWWLSTRVVSIEDGK